MVAVLARNACAKYSARLTSSEQQTGDDDKSYVWR
jgi:hypothetical protein